MVSVKKPNIRKKRTTLTHKNVRTIILSVKSLNLNYTNYFLNQYSHFINLNATIK